MDKDKITKDDHIGSFMIDVPELQAQGQSSKWYPLFYKNKPAGEILMEASFQCEGFIRQNPNMAQSEFIQREEAMLDKLVIMEEEVMVNQT